MQLLLFLFLVTMSDITGRSLQIRERDDDRDDRDDLDDNRGDGLDAILVSMVRTSRAHQALLRDHRDRLEVELRRTVEKARRFREAGARIQKLVSEGRVDEAENFLAMVLERGCPGCDDRPKPFEIDVVNGEGTLCDECAQAAIEEPDSLCTAAQNCAGVSLTQRK